MAKKKDKEKKGFFGRLFGGKEQPDATPAADAGGGEGELTMAPGYAGQGGPQDPGDKTMLPGYAQGGPGKGPAVGHVSFGTGRHERPPISGEHDMTMAPGYASPGDELAQAERTIAPDYTPDGAPADPFGGLDDGGVGELTMAPGYAGARPDPFVGRGVDQGAPTAKNPAVADPFADFGDEGGAGDLTMAPGYAGAKGPAPGPAARASGAPGPAADPFADLGAGDLTMAPGYAGAKAQPAADPFADLGSGDLTMAPGYAGAKAQPAADPFADLGGGPGARPGGPPGPAADPFADAFGADPLGGPAPDALTMAPGYAGASRGAPGKAADPFEDVFGADPVGGPAPDAMTMAPGYSAATKNTDPFADMDVDKGFDPGITMAPAYSGKKRPAPGSGPARKPTLSGPAPADPFAFDLDAGGPAAGDARKSPSDAGPMIEVDAFELEPVAPAVPAPSRPAPGLSESGDGFDPFGPALLDDPFAQAPGTANPNTSTEPGLPTARPAAPMPPVAPTARPGGAPAPHAPVKALAVEAAPAADEDGDFRGERTMVELTSDLDMLATLESTDEMEAAAVPPPEPVAIAAPPPMPAPVGAVPPVAGPPAAPPPRPAPRARPLFQGARPDRAGVRHVGAAAEVVLDAARGLVFAPSVEGGWTGLPVGFQTLGDGGVLGRGRVEGRDVVVTAPVQGEVRLTLPAGVKVDRHTRAVLWPAELEAQLAWRPRLVDRTPAGLVFTMPPGTRFDEGACVIPAEATTPPPAPGARDAWHGAVVTRLEYLGLVEEVHEDGWSKLGLPAGATLEGARLLLPKPSARAATAPPLLRPERLRDGRLAIDLPAGAQSAGGAVWLPPAAAPAPTLGEPWADHDAPVTETREYAGVVEEALADGWVRLELPDGARLTRTPEGAPRVVIAAEYSTLGDPAALAELERLPDGSLAFDLPTDAECLGTRVLIPPPGTAPPRSEFTLPEPRPAKQEKGRRKDEERPDEEVRRAVVEDRAAPEPEPAAPASSKKMKALDRFRKDKKPRDDSMTFDGVLRGPVEASTSGGAVSEDVPDGEMGPQPPRAKVEEPEPVAVEAVGSGSEAAAAMPAEADAAPVNEGSSPTLEAAVGGDATPVAEVGVATVEPGEAPADAPAAEPTAPEADELSFDPAGPTTADIASGDTTTEPEAGADGAAEPEPEEAKGKTKRRKRKGKNGS